jgi:sugar lactone lactonase YvrE
MVGLPVFLDGIDFGEGPRWHDGRLWFSDLYQHSVSSVGGDGVRVVELEIDDRPSGLGWLPDGRLLVVAMQSRTVLRQEHDGSVVVHADLSEIATAACNDMVVAADGTAYVGNLGFDHSKDEPRRTANLARVRIDGTIDVVADDFLIPNGAVITSDGCTLIVGETSRRCATAFTISPDGSLHDRRLWADLGDALPDGCSLDADNAIWFADATRTEILRVREGGEITHRVEVGQPAFACTLGGDDGKTLFVLAADSAHEHECIGTGRGTIRTLQVDVPHAGLP